MCVSPPPLVCQSLSLIFHYLFHSKPSSATLSDFVILLSVSLSFHVFLYVFPTLSLPSLHLTPPLFALLYLSPLLSFSLLYVFSLSLRLPVCQCFFLSFPFRSLSALSIFLPVPPPLILPLRPGNDSHTRCNTTSSSQASVITTACTMHIPGCKTLKGNCPQKLRPEHIFSLLFSQSNSK